jgi:hypothetical protein
MADRRVPRPYFRLKIWVDDTTYPGLREKYEAAAETHNAAVQPYMHGCPSGFDAGFDLFLPASVTVPGGARSVKVPHGIHCSMTRVGDRMMRKRDESWSGMWLEDDLPGREVGFYLYVRSSTGAKTPLRLSNHVGIIDAPYRGDITALFDNADPARDHVCERHQRLVQVCAPELSHPILVELVESVDDLGRTARGTGGFGSTGN